MLCIERVVLGYTMGEFCDCAVNKSVFISHPLIGF